MTTTFKDSVEAGNPGKQGAQSKDSAGKPTEGARCNPVCLELGVTVRSLPSESGGLTKPIRFEGRTVIVFDNGAVLRCAENLPIGQTFILSNPNGRDVVCQVVGGRNLPSIKGYVEVQFMEPVNDFWGIHENTSASVMAPKSTEVLRESIQPPASPAPIIATVQREIVAKPDPKPAGSAPSFDDIGGLLSIPTNPAAQERKAPSMQAPSERTASNVSAYSQTGGETPGLLANLNSPEVVQSDEKIARQPVAEALPNLPSSAPVSKSSHTSSANVFSSKGIMAAAQREPDASVLGGRMPMIVGIVALVLAGAGAGAYVMHRSFDRVPVAMTAPVSQPSAPQPSAPVNPPVLDAPPPADSSQMSTQNVAVEQGQVGAVVSAIPAVVSNAGANESKIDSKAGRRADIAANSREQSASSATRKPSIPNLHIGSPTAPSGKVTDLGAGAAPLADLAESQPVGAATTPGLLTSSGRISGQPAPPENMASAPVPAPMQVSAAKTVAPKLISSTRLSYPPSAKQTGIQGTVTVIASVDANGIVSNVKALNGPLLLQQAAVESVKQWKYAPGTIDGRPAPSQVTVSVEFKLN